MSMKHIEIRGGRVVDPATQFDEAASVYVVDGKIAGLGQTPAGFKADQVIDATGLVVAPGLVDLSARIASNIDAELEAAVAGGVTTLACPPDVDPIIDEPELGELMDESFAIAPDIAIDLMSGALAAVEHEAIAGLHCCADIEVAPLLAAGPSILSVPVRESLVDDAGQISKFLHNGGTIAWGVVPTDGPITNTPVATSRSTR